MPLIFQASLQLFGYGPSVCLWWWKPCQAGRVFETHRRYLTVQIGRFEMDLQWI